MTDQAKHTMSSNRILQVGALAFVTTIAACAKAPAEAIGMATQAEDAASAAGAVEYAPDAMHAVTEARAAMEAEVAAQDERMAIRRSYDRAEELAVAYQQAGERAAQAAADGRQAARTEATLMIEETKVMLTEVLTMLDTAPVGKGSHADLAAMRIDLEAAEAGLLGAETSMASEKFLEAKTGVTATRETVANVKAAVQQALAMRVR